MIVSSQKLTDGIEAPSITIQASTDSNYGWKSSINFSGVIEGKCGQAGSIKECILNETYSQEESIHESKVGWFSNKSLLSPEFWREDFTSAIHGRTYTLKINKTIGPDMTDFVFLLFSPTLKISIWLHDENFFLLNENPVALPSLYKKFDPPTSSLVPPMKVYFYLTLIEHQKLSLGGSSCIEDHNYKFKSCVKDSLAVKVSCDVQGSEKVASWMEDNSKSRRKFSPETM